MSRAASTPLFSLPRLAKSLVLGALALATAVGTAGCLDRPIGREQPRTTNVIVDQLVQSSVDKIDLLFVVDNSISMADKQEILALALPDLVGRLVSPICVDSNGNDTGQTPATANENCPSGSAREFNPIDDIHIGVITSSLGGFGAFADCVQSSAEASEQTVDMAYLLGLLPRGADAAPSAQAEGGFLKWTAGSQRNVFVEEFSNLVRESGEFGCGWEATLEAWYRFLVEPYPYTKIVRQPCNSNDMNNLCAGPETDNDGRPLVDNNILKQRAQFLRPDSLLAIVMLSDENDCSFKASGQTWRLSQTVNENGSFNPAFKGTAACNDPQYGPNHECCHSCGQANPPPSGCPSATDADDRVVGVGCEDDRRYTVDSQDDHPNLRCFQQKRRFGVDYLYPVERYSNALQQTQICPFAETLSTDDPVCAGGANVVVNPLFRDLPYEAELEENPNTELIEALPRAPSLIFLAGIVGVPWQDVAMSANDSDTLVYKVNREGAEAERLIDWDLILGPDPMGGLPMPADPLMRESVEPRSGTNPATGEALAPPDSGFRANSINGHEWNIADKSDLQYACIFPLIEEKECISQELYRELSDNGEAVPNCDCTDFGGDEFRNPLCQAPNGSYDQTQRYAKAYPSLRQLEVLRDYGGNSIVASICPKETSNMNAPDFGFRPAVGAIVDRLKEQLADKCLTRSLSVRDDAMGNPEAACIIVEAKRLGANESPDCTGSAREPVEADVDPVVREQLERTFQCSNPQDCASFQLCEITQLTASNAEQDYVSCLNNDVATGNGWCYVDPSRNLGSESLVEKCPTTARRKLRFVGSGTPDPGTVTFFACAGEAF